MICLSVIWISVSLKWLYMVHTLTFSSPRRTESLVHRSVLRCPRWRWHRGPLGLMKRTKVTIRLMFFRIQHANSLKLTHQWPRLWEKQILVWWLDSASVCLPELRCCFCSDTSKPSYHPASEARPAGLTAKHSAHLQTHKNRVSNRPVTEALKTNKHICQLARTFLIGQRVDGAYRSLSPWSPSMSEVLQTASFWCSDQCSDEQRKEWIISAPECLH